ncbi:MAG TPA: VOC family protein [Acidobacteriota bacterium]|nr:VOC family protein [Acidobacteriota bacterium]
MPARKKTRRPASKSARRATAPKRTKAAKRKAAPKRAAKRPAKKPAARRTAKPAGAARHQKAPAAAPPPTAAANAVGFLMQHLDYTTHDPDAVRRFYVETLGFAEANHDPSFNYLYVRTGATSSLGFMPPMPGMGAPSPVKEPTIYIIVEDVDRTYADLSMKGVHFEGPPADMPWGHRVVSTSDPEGRRVMLATVTMTNG